MAGDSLSYFAKMGQGQQGQWLFHLPYTAQTHAGIPIYTYYLFLGHIARWTALPIPLIFHLARVVNGLILLLVIYLFIRQLTEIKAERRFIFTLVAISSGLGWLAATIGVQSTDLTIPESNTFYTLMNNPHFPLSQALLLLIAMSYLFPPATNRKMLIGELSLVAIASILLASLQPYMLIVTWGIALFYSIWLWWDNHRVPQAPMLRLVVSVVVGGAVVAMTAMALISDPLLQGWMNQNLTPSPAVFSYVSGYGLLLIPAAYGAIWAIRARPQAGKVMLVWILVTLLAVYAPTTIQRRFVSGAHVPLAILAGLGICRVWMPRWGLMRRWAWAYLVLTCLTSVVIVLIVTRVTLANSASFFLSAEESQALAWLQEHAPPDGVVVSSPELGAFIPAFTSQRVVVGHWAETVDFAATSLQVQRFYSTASSSPALCPELTEWGANYLLVGPRERDIGATDLDASAGSGLIKVAQFNDVEIYQVDCALLRK